MKELTIFNVQPLHGLPLTCLVLEFELDVALPGYVGVVDGDVCGNVVVGLGIQLEGVIKH